MQQHLHQPTCGIFVQRGVWGFGRGRHYFIGYDVKREGKKKKGIRYCYFSLQNCYVEGDRSDNSLKKKRKGFFLPSVLH